jgi:hypothetical protein
MDSACREPQPKISYDRNHGCLNHRAVFDIPLRDAQAFPTFLASLFLITS